jgi:hypothetical protein
MGCSPGTIGVLSGDQSRWSWFTQSLINVVNSAPSGTEVLWINGLWIAAAVNKMVANMAGEWLCILADDHILPADMIPRLLAHEQDIVAPLCCLRRLPYQPSLFHDTPNGYVGYTWEELEGKNGLLAVDTFGGPGVMIRRHVFEAIGAPFFEAHPGYREAPHEDLYTFSKCRQAGFQPYVDLDMPIGHILPAAVFPHVLQNGGWRVRLWAEQDLALLQARQPPTSAKEYHAHT